MPTILLVEDEPTLAETLRYNLEREGYTVLSAGDGVRDGGRHGGRSGRALGVHLVPRRAGQQGSCDA